MKKKTGMRLIGFVIGLAMGLVYSQDMGLVGIPLGISIGLSLGLALSSSEKCKEAK